MRQITLEKLNNNILSLQREINMLRSFIVGAIGQDKEGKYNPEFIKKTLKINKERARHSFKDKNSFLAKIK